MNATALGLSVAAILVSLASLGVSLYVALRDRARLRVTAQYMQAFEYDRAHIRAVLVNTGRRTLILRLRGGSVAGGKHWMGTHLEHEQGGMRLEEHERHEHSFYIEDLEDSAEDGATMEFATLWFEDSLGRRYELPKAKKLIAQLRADKSGQ